jgi:N-acetyl-alpha-D-muramate 1-phosphate uridylyltransferase
MLERVALRLIAAGATRLVINTHHFARQIVEFVEARDGFGVEVLFSHEPERPLETGGGLRHAASLFLAEAPLFLHNADILSDLPLRTLYDEHLRRSPLATLAVMRRETPRFLLFDDDGLLGRVDEGRGIRIEVRPRRGALLPLAFAGVHVAAPEILDLTHDDEEAFSILDVYLRAAGEGQRVDPFRVDSSSWIDVGKPDQLAHAEKWISEVDGRPVVPVNERPGE